MKTKILFAALLAIASINVRAEAELTGSPAELTQLLNLPKTVSLSGSSELKVAADRAVITLKVVTENKSLQEAMEANQEIRTKIINTLKDRGISTNRIQGARFSSSPQYGLFKEKAKSYRVENEVKVSAADEKESQLVARLVDAHPEVRYEGIEFEHSDKDGLKAKAQAMALDKAVDKKRLFEEKLGVRLTPIRFFDNEVTFAKFNQMRPQIGTVTSLPSSPSFEANRIEAVGDMPSSFGEMTVKANVTVEYSLTAK